MTGHISSAGKLVLPAKTVAHLEVDLDTTFFKVGIDEGKRKVKSLYLVASISGQDAFSFEKAAQSYTLAQPFIFTKSGVDFTKTKYDSTIHLFKYEGQTALALKLASEAGATKAPCTGKPRGPKRRQDHSTE